MGQCLGRRLTNYVNTRNIYLDTIDEESPLDAAMRIMFQASDTGISHPASDSDFELKQRLEYLQGALILDYPIVGAVAYIVIRESPLPSKEFLCEVESTLGLSQITQNIACKPIKSVDVDCNMDLEENVTQLPEKKSSKSKSVKCCKKRGDSSATSSKTTKSIGENISELKYARNSCIILDCLAVKMSGYNATLMLRPELLQFLLECLIIGDYKNANSNTKPVRLQVTLHALLAIEKFCQTRQCLVEIQHFFSSVPTGYPTLIYESWANSKDPLRRQIGFCSVYLNDNMLDIPNRELTYKSIDRTDLNAVLNTEDVSHYLKISPDGLEARCDCDFFESVRCTYEVCSGTFYYEIVLVTDGIMQIGWATKESPFFHHEGHGIGDDAYSIAFDGYRQTVWYDALPHKETAAGKWKAGDVIGCLLSCEQQVVIFYVNGKPLKKRTELFRRAKSGFYAAASFLCNQQCIFNFGRSNFVYPPKNWSFETFNSLGRLTEVQKTILPRNRKKDSTQSIPDNYCTLCFSDLADCVLLPCNHGGFCKQCTTRISDCPLCRIPIRNVSSVHPSADSKETPNTAVCQRDDHAATNSNHLSLLQHS